MDKTQLIEQIKQFASNKQITKEELNAAYDSGAVKTTEKESIMTHHLNIAEVLYYIGGLIVIIGIIVLIVQHWEELNLFSRLLVTLGVGITSYITSIIIGRYEKLDSISQVFGLISAPTTAIGIKFLMDDFGVELQTSTLLSIISGIMLTFQLVSYFFYKKFIFLFLSILFATLFFFSFTNFLFEQTNIESTLALHKYSVLIAGLSYLIPGHYFTKAKLEGLVGFLNGFGVVGFLGAALALGNWKPEQNIFWEIIFPGLALGVVFLSVYLRASAYLLFGTLFLMVYILKITYEYF